MRPCRVATGLIFILAAGTVAVSSRAADVSLGTDSVTLPASAPEREGWEIVWSDEFEGATGELPDADNWRFDIGTGWGNAQLEFDTMSPANVSLDGGGNLRITAHREEHRGQAFTSGRINTLGMLGRTYGRFEARIRLPRGAGIWPAFWMLGENFEDVGWPDCGEIDILEYRGQERDILHGSLHGPGYSAGEAVTASFRLESGTLDEDFHVFAVEWDPERIRWFLDETNYRTVTPQDLPEGGRWVFDHPFILILNVAVGGHFVGPPNDETSFPQTMLVDWVRVYDRQT